MMNLSVIMKKFRLPVLMLLVAVLFSQIAVPVYAAKTASPIDGVSINSDTDCINISGTTVTITAEGGGLSNSGDTVEFTIMNTSGSPARITFDYTVKNKRSCTFSSDSGTVTTDPLADNASTDVFSLTAKGWWGGDATITLQNFRVEAEKAFVATFKPAECSTVNHAGAVGYKVNGQTVSVDGTYPFEGVSSVLAYAIEEPANYHLNYLKDDAGNIFYPGADGTVVLNGVNSDISLTPVFVYSESEVAPFRVNGREYWFWEEAFTAAGTSHTVIVNTNYTLPTTLAGNNLTENGNYVKLVDGKVVYDIPENAKLLVPYSAADNGLFAAMSTNQKNYFFADSNNVTSNKNVNTLLDYAPKPYVTLTIPSDVTVTCRSQGAISLSGTMLIHGNRATGNGQTIAYNGNKVGYIDLDGKIILESKSNLYCYGYIIGDGTVEVLADATVHELLELGDHKGGDAGSNYTSTDVFNTFPYNQYYAQNVEADLLLQKGATNTVYMGFVTSLKNVIDDVQFVGSSGLFRMTGTDGNILREYDGSTDRVTYTVNGDMEFSSIKVSLENGYGTTTIDSAKYIMPINNNITINVNSGVVTITKDIALLPETIVIIGKDATLQVKSDAKVYIYDKMDWKGFAYHLYSVCPKEFSPTRDGVAFKSVKNIRQPGQHATLANSARLIINGTMNIYGNVFTTRGGHGPIKIGESVTETPADFADSKSVDKLITSSTGTGIINNMSDWQTDQAMSQMKMQGSEKKSRSLWVIYCDPAVARIAGVDNNNTYSTFATGTTDNPATYTAFVLDGVTYWKQNGLAVIGDSSAITVVNGSLNTGIAKALNYVSDLSVASGKQVLTNNASGRVINEKFLTFTLAEGYKVDAINATLSRAEDGTYTLSNVTGDVTIKVTPLEGCEHEWDDATCTTPKTCSVCGATEGEALGHTPAEAVENEVAATCTTDGSYDTVVYCSVCDAELSRVPTVIPATGHTAGEAVVENEVTATCTADGSYDTVVYCTVCNAELSRVTTTVPANGHTEGEVVVEKEVAATCTAEGSYDNVVYCTVCKAELSRETTTVPATGHTAGEAVKENEKAPSYNAAGSYDSVVYCSVCKAELSRETVSVPELAGAEASIGNTKYGTLEEALAIGGEVTLLASIDADKAFEIKNPVVLDLNGFNVSATEKDTVGDGVFHVIAGGDLTINGEGVINGASKGNNYSIAIWADGGKVTINGGTYTNVGAGEDNHYDLIYVKNGGEVVINGGTFIAQTPAWTLNSHDTSKGTITVYGGSFHDFNPCNSKAEGVGTNFCADGYCAVEENGYYTVQKHSYESTVTAPTCTAAGYTTYTCACGDSYVTDEVAALGHTEVIDAATEPDCVNSGLTEGKRCFVCNEVLVAQTEVPALGHTEETVAGKAATCTETGLTDGVKCSVCDTVITAQEVIPAQGHNEVVDEAVDATCTATGLTEGKHCDRCSEILVAQTETQMLNHNWANAEGKCTACGTTHAHSWDENHVCIECGYGCGDHDYKVTETVEPTCTEQGYTVYTCSICGHSYNGDIQDAGHTPAEAIVENDVEATCIADGSYDTVVYCSVCDEELSRVNIVVPATGHSYQAVATAPTCTEKGYTTHTCAGCDDSYVDSYVNALGHTEAEAVTENSVGATCTADGSYETVVYCSVCNAQLSRKTTTVPATGHTAGEAVKENETADAYESVVYCETCGAELNRETINKEPEGPVEDENLKFYTVSLGFSSYIGVQAIVEQKVVADYDSFYIVANGAKIEGHPHSTNKNFYVFEIPVDANLMTQTITFTLYGEADELVHIGQTKNCSVEGLALEKIETYHKAGYPAYCKVLVDMLKYGAAAQDKFSPKDQTLADDNLGDYENTYATTGTFALQGNGNQSVGDGPIKNYRVSISLRSVLEIQVPFQHILSEYKVEVLCDGTPVAATLSYDTPGFTNIKIPVGAINVRTEYSITVYDSVTGAQKSPTYLCSAEGCTQAYMDNPNATDADKAVAVALIRYGDAVRAAFPELLTK